MNLEDLEYDFCESELRPDEPTVRAVILAKCLVSNPHFTFKDERICRFLAEAEMKNDEEINEYTLQPVNPTEFEVITAEKDRNNYEGERIEEIVTIFDEENWEYC